jgi:hypothetical protein
LFSIYAFIKFIKYNIQNVIKKKKKIKKKMNMKKQTNKKKHGKHEKKLQFYFFVLPRHNNLNDLCRRQAFKTHSL